MKPEEMGRKEGDWPAMLLNSKNRYMGTTRMTGCGQKEFRGAIRVRRRKVWLCR